jgi:hypothetical protein
MEAVTAEDWTRPPVVDERDAIAEGCLWLWVYSVKWDDDHQVFF